MKQVFTLLALALVVLVLAQCSPKTPAAATGNSKASNSAVTAGTALVNAEALEKGKVIFQGSCGRCHKLFAPESRTMAQWNRILPEMYHKSKLSKEQSAMVDQYVLANAKKG